MDITRGCLHAERSAGRKERPAWSEDLHHTHLSVVYPKIAIRALHRNRDFTAAVAPFLESSDSFTPPSFTDLPSACTALQAATATLKEIRANAKAYREAFLEEKAQAAVAAMDVTAEQAINILLQREGTKKAYATLRRYLRSGEFSPVTEVHVEKPDGSIEVVNDPEEMYQRIIDRDIKHYNQAEGTPCTVAPVKAWLGLAGTTNRFESWLAGSSTPTVEGALPESQLLFDLFKCETPPPPCQRHRHIIRLPFLFRKVGRENLDLAGPPSRPLEGTNLAHCGHTLPRRHRAHNRSPRGTNEHLRQIWLRLATLAQDCIGKIP